MKNIRSAFISFLAAVGIIAVSCAPNEDGQVRAMANTDTNSYKFKNYPLNVDVLTPVGVTNAIDGKVLNKYVPLEYQNGSTYIGTIDMGPGLYPYIYFNNFLIQANYPDASGGTGDIDVNHGFSVLGHTNYKMGEIVCNSKTYTFPDSTGGTFALTSDIPTTLAALSGDATHRVVTDTEKSTWNGKQDKLVAGSNISIVGNVISASGGGGGDETDPVFTEWRDGTSIVAGFDATIENASHAVAIGGESLVNGDLNVAIGYQAKALDLTGWGEGASIAVGNGSYSARYGNISIGGNAQTVEETSIAIGADTSANKFGDIAIGASAVVDGAAEEETYDSYAIGIGTEANVTGSHSIGIGGGVQSSKNYAITVGPSSQNNGAYSVLIGTASYLYDTAEGAVNIGVANSTHSAKGVSIGYHVDNAGGSDSVNIGQSQSSEKASNSILLGQENTVSETQMSRDPTQVYLIGTKNHSTALTDNVIIGAGNGVTNANQAIAIGFNNNVTSSGGLASMNAVSIGYNTSAGSGSVSIGNGASTVSSSVAIGPSASTKVSAAVAIGSGATTTAMRSTAIGYNSKAIGAGTSAIGVMCTASNTSATVVGRASTGYGSQSIAIGYQAKTSTEATGGIAIGYNAEANALGSVQIGTGTNPTANSLQFQTYPVIGPDGKLYVERIPITPWVSCGSSGLGQYVYVRRSGNVVEMKCDAPQDTYSNYTSSVNWNSDTLIPEGFRPETNINAVPCRIYSISGGGSTFSFGIIYNTGRWRPAELYLSSNGKLTTNPTNVYRILNFNYTYITTDSWPAD